MPKSTDKCTYCFHSAYEHGHRDYEAKWFYDGICAVKNCPCFDFEEKKEDGSEAG